MARPETGLIDVNDPCASRSTAAQFLVARNGRKPVSACNVVNALERSRTSEKFSSFFIDRGTELDDYFYYRQRIARDAVMVGLLGSGARFTAIHPDSMLGKAIVDRRVDPAAMKMLHESFEELPPGESMITCRDIVHASDLCKCWNDDVIPSIKIVDKHESDIARIPACIGNLAGLEDLEVSMNIAKIENLESLTKLTRLNLFGTDIAKIENLDHAVNLKMLGLGKTKITKIEGLDALVNLQDLHLSHNHIKKMEGMDALSSLRSLLLSNNAEIARIEGLDNLSSLRSLALRGTAIEKIEGLDTLVNLEKLDLSNTRVARIKNLDKLVNLRELLLNGTPVAKIAGLEQNKKLERLNLIDTNVPNARCAKFRKQHPMVRVQC